MLRSNMNSHLVLPLALVTANRALELRIYPTFVSEVPFQNVLMFVEFQTFHALKPFFYWVEIRSQELPNVTFSIVVF